MGLAVDDLAAYAVAQGLGSLGTSLMKFGFTPKPDEQIALIPYSGLASEQRFGEDALGYEFPRIQVVSRATTSRQSFENAHAAYLAFGQIIAMEIEGTFWHSVHCLQPPMTMGTDDTGRPLWGFNVSCQKDV